MIWLTLIIGLQILGFGVTLARLAFDEWQQWRLSRQARKSDTGPPDSKKVQAMESDNVIFLERGIRKAERRLWNFSYPHQVVGDPDLSMDEKRAILAAWASDEHAVDSMPTLRHLPGTPAAVTFASIMDARARLDRLAGAANDDDPPPSPVKFRHAATWEPFKGAA